MRGGAAERAMKQTASRAEAIHAAAVRSEGNRIAGPPYRAADNEPNKAIEATCRPKNGRLMGAAAT